MAPGLLPPAENRHVYESHEALAEDVYGDERRDGVLGEAVAVVHRVYYERDRPEDHVHAGVDEEEAELALDCAAAERYGGVGEALCCAYSR